MAARRPAAFCRPGDRRKLPARDRHDSRVGLLCRVGVVMLCVATVAPPVSTVVRIGECSSASSGPVLGILAFLLRLRKYVSKAVGCSPQRLVLQVGITHSCLRLSVSQQLADDFQRGSIRDKMAGV
jgi:hypothetical protein